MGASGNHPFEAEVIIPLNLQGDSSDPASEQEAPSSNGDVGRNKQNAGEVGEAERALAGLLCKNTSIRSVTSPRSPSRLHVEENKGIQLGLLGDWCRFCRSIKTVWKVAIVVLAITLGAIAVVVGLTLHFRGKTNQSEGTSTSTPSPEVMSVMSASTPLPEVNSSCPEGWIPNEDRCYHFSENETTWDLSQDICTSYGGVLFVPRTPQEWDFMKETKPPGEYWMGLRTENSDAWEAPDWLEIKGTGLCATLNYDTASSTDCDSIRLLICCKRRHAFHRNQKH